MSESFRVNLSMLEKFLIHAVSMLIALVTSDQCPRMKGADFKELRLANVLISSKRLACEAITEPPRFIEF